MRDRHKKFLDYCPSGQVDLAGFKTIVRSFVPIGDPMKFAEALFRVVDEDRNGTVDYKVRRLRRLGGKERADPHRLLHQLDQDFICALSTVFRARPEEKLRCTFAHFFELAIRH